MLQETPEKHQKMPIDKPRVIQITEALPSTLLWMTDHYPLSKTADFAASWACEQRYDIPSHHYIVHTVTRYMTLWKKHIHSLLPYISAFSLTTDIWTSSVCPMSLISLTAQWVDEDFCLQNVILASKTTSGLAHHSSYNLGHSKNIYSCAWALMLGCLACRVSLTPFSCC